MDVNKPEIVAEVAAAFEEYERALVMNDVEAMNALFWDTPETVRDGIAEVQHKVRQNIKYGADLIKICATGGVLSKGDDPQASQYTLEEMQAIVADAHRLGRKVLGFRHQDVRS